MERTADCVAKDTRFCAWQNHESCEGCFMSTLKGDDQASAHHNFEVMCQNLPEDFDELTGDTCHFCRTTPKKQTCYAIVDMAHPEPKTKKPMFFGIGKKIDNPIGSLLPTYISCCSDCKKSYFMLDFLKWGVLALFIVLGIVFITIPALMGLLGTPTEFTPFLVLIAFVILGLVVANLWWNVLYKKLDKRVKLNVFDIPIVHEMGEKGWFLVQNQKDDGNRDQKLIFTKKRPHRGKLMGS